MAKRADVKGEDVPIVNLVPLHERSVSKTGYRKILASIRAVGLIEPLCVYKEGSKYVILDGYLRYRACLDLGVETVPCLILPDKEAYTCSRMVSYLSPVQENRMLTRSLETIDEKTIAGALGLASIKHRLNDHLLRQLHPQVAGAFDNKRIMKVCAEEMTFVKPERQVTILKEMGKTGDFSAAYVRTLILRTPPSLRNRKKRAKAPWDRGARQKKELTAKLEEAERRYDFYTKLYRQYVADLMKLCIYVRRLISNKRIAAYLKTRHPEILDSFQGIIFETEGGGK